MRALRAGRVGPAVARAAPGPPRRARGRGRRLAQRHARVRAGGGGALERGQRGAGEEDEGHEGRYGVAGQADHQRVVARAEPGRLARPQRDAPEDLVTPSCLQRRLDVVVGADGDAAADEQEVGAFERLAQRGRGAPRGRRRPRRLADDLGARFAGEGGEGERVGVVDLAGAAAARRAATSSSPVATIATRGRRATRSVARPAPAATPSAAGVIRVPRASTTAPARRSSPARRT